ELALGHRERGLEPDEPVGDLRQVAARRPLRQRALEIADPEAQPLDPRYRLEPAALLRQHVRGLVGIVPERVVLALLVDPLDLALQGTQRRPGRELLAGRACRGDARLDGFARQ